MNCTCMPHVRGFTDKGEEKRLTNCTILLSVSKLTSTTVWIVLGLPWIAAKRPVKIIDKTLISIDLFYLAGPTRFKRRVADSANYNLLHSASTQRICDVLQVIAPQRKPY
jgi:hypothetical protein